MTKVTRQTWVDYAKGIAIILVLYRHVFEGIKNSGISIVDYISIEHINVLLFSFRMPLFFIVSGIFIGGSLQKRGFGGLVLNKSKTILYPYFLWGFLQISLQIFFSRYVNSSRTAADYLYLLYEPRQIEQFWYLYALFNVTVGYSFAKAILKLNAIQNIGIGLAMFYLSAIASQKAISLGFVGDFIHYYLFYAIGDAISRLVRDKNNFKYFESNKILLVLLVPFIISQGYFLYANLQAGDYFFLENYRPIVFILIALTGCVFILCLSFCLQKWDRFKWLQVLGKHSLYIYVSHVMVLAAVRIAMTKLFKIYNVPALLITGIVFGLVLPVLIYKLAIKLKMPWLYSLENTTAKSRTNAVAQPAV